MSEKVKLKEVLGETISREEALRIIQTNYHAHIQFQEFPVEHQEKVLEFIQGTRGLPILYDSFFKNIFNPHRTPERLERFLSCLMEQKIRIIQVIPREGTQLIDKGSFVIMDILVETEDGSYINVEMQKHGYEFTGERSTCYMSDLVMRQYSQVKSERKQKFSFKDLKPVYLIVLMENSTKNFKDVSPQYIHRVHYSCDTGADINFLANYTYISLDTFHLVRHNIDSYIDAWFTFLSSDAPEDILNLIESYPEFKEYYHDIALFRKNPKELINMYSDALIQMDRNTVNYMIEEMQKEVEELSATIAENQDILARQETIIAEKDNTIAEKDAYIKELEAKLASR